VSGKKKVVAIALAAAAVVALAGTWLALQYALRRAVYQAIDKIQRDSDGGVALKVGDVSVNPLLQQATLSDVSIELKGAAGPASNFHVNTLKVVRWKKLDGSKFLRELTLEWRGVRSPQFDWQLASASPGVKKILGDSLLFDVTHTSIYRPEQQHALDVDASFSSAKLGTLSLHLATSGIDVKELERLAREQKAHQPGRGGNAQIQASLQAALMQAQLRDASLGLRNAGAFEAFLASQAAATNTTPEEQRRQLKETLRARCAAPTVEAWLKRMCPALTTFVDEPQSLRLTLVPAAPVPLVEALAGGVDTLVERVNLKLVANEKP
jgi:hypothetical protein